MFQYQGTASYDQSTLAMEIFDSVKKTTKLDIIGLNILVTKEKNERFDVYDMAGICSFDKRNIIWIITIGDSRCSLYYDEKNKEQMLNELVILKLKYG